MKSTIKTFILVFLAAALFFVIIPTARANADDEYDDYTIILKPGLGTGSAITITDGSGIDDYTIDEEEGIYIFGYACPDCPNGFNAPAGKEFLGWSAGGKTYHKGDIVPLDDIYTLELTALWGESGDTTLKSLTVQGGTLTQAFSPDVYQYKAMVYSDGTHTITVHGEPTDSNAIVRYNGKETCEPSWSIDVDVINGTSVSKYVVRIDVVSTITVTVEGQGTAWVGGFFNKNEVMTIARDGEAFSLVARPEKGWKLKEWQLVSGEGEINSWYGTFHAGSTNVVLKAVFERVPCEITFNPDGGSVDLTSAITNADGKIESLPTPAKEGMKFKGWYTSDGNRVTVDTVYYDNTELIAHWYKDSSAEIEVPETVDIIPFSEWTAFPVVVNALDLQENAYDKTPDRVRIVFTAGTLVNSDDPSQTIQFKLDNYDTDSRTPRTQRMLDAKGPSEQQLFIYIPSADFEGAMPGLYTGTIEYVADWMYLNPVYLEAFESGTVTVSVMITPPGMGAPDGMGTPDGTGAPSVIGEGVAGSASGSPAAVASADNSKTEDASYDNAPKTGDANDIRIWTLIMAVVLFTFFVVLYIREIFPIDARRMKP